MTAAAAGGRAPVAGIAGKLPAHGDFVRRGGPVAALALIDRWLDAELGGAVAGGIALDDAVAALDGWRFAFAGADGAAILAVALAGEDAVGRRFPLVGLLAGTRAAPDAAEAWCAAAADALARARDAGDAGDAALAAIAAIAPPSADPANGADAAAGWWRAGDPAPTGEARLPMGAAFRALLAERAA